MFKRISALLAAIVMLLSLSACGKDDKYIFHNSDAVKGYKAFGQAGSAEAPADENLVLVNENEYLGLYYHKETYVVSVFDKRTGRFYSTNHTNEEPDKKNSQLAALNLVYSNSQGKTGTIDSYTQSVVLNQVKVEKKGKTVTFNYDIGDVSDGLEVTPSIISNERFEMFLEKANESQKKILKRRYSFIKDYNSWSRRKIANPTAIEQLVQTFKDLGYTSEDLAKDNAENGVADTGDSKLAFSVPLSFTLDGDSVIASIELQKVKYPERNPLIQIEFLQFFGAVTEGEKGYFLLPDGSGAIMPFEKVESGTIGYEAAVYGNDKALRASASSAESKTALLPIYGASYDEKSGFLAVIEDGEALADIFAYNSGATDEYSKIYSRLNFLKTESVSLGDQQASDNFNYYNFQEKSYTGNYKVRYIFLENGKSDYSGMAAAYRNYLSVTDKMPESKMDDNSPFLLETVGGILADKSFLGFKYKGITALTEYGDNTLMAEKLNEAGIENINIKLTAFSGDGLQNTIPKKIKLIGNLGGKSEFKELLTNSDKHNFKIYPDFEYLTFSANSGLVTKNNYAIKSMDSKAAELPIYNKATLLLNTQFEDNLYYLTAINSLSDVNKNIKKHLNKYGVGRISIADMASGVSSDFTAKASYDRQSATNLSGKIIKALSDNYEVMLNGTNAANAKYADFISDAPLFSGGYVFSESVPFYQMVYHGAVDYCGEAINLSDDIQKEFLRSVEYGASIKYTLIYRNRDAIKNSDYTYLYAADFDSNFDNITENYKKINLIYKKISKAKMVSHTKLADSVYCTEYENGVKTVVNYSDSDYAGNIGTVKAKDFIITE